MMAAQFAKDLRDALERFDYQAAENLMERIREAEEDGYELLRNEESLLARLVRCMEQFRRAALYAE
jgi:hypothetical protein